MYTREQTRAVEIGGVKIGGGNPVRIQSMTNTKTQDAQATIQQILRLEQAGCEIVRVTVPDQGQQWKLSGTDQGNIYISRW